MICAEINMQQMPAGYHCTWLKPDLKVVICFYKDVMLWLNLVI
jgi:hypothetical protein